MTCGCNNSTTALTIDGRISDPRERWRRRQYWLAERLLGCMRCHHQTRWLGLDWCGEPWPKRAALWLWRVLFNPRRQSEGDSTCGCLLNIKRQLEREECGAGWWKPMTNLEPPTACEVARRGRTRNRRRRIQTTVTEGG